MNLDKIRSIQFSLMKKERDLENGKANYLKYKTAKFIVPENFLSKEKIAEELVSQMYNDLMDSALDYVDCLGLWIEYDSTVLENAISLNTLNSISEYSQTDINPIFEFFKMTLSE